MLGRARYLNKLIYLLFGGGGVACYCLHFFSDGWTHRKDRNQGELYRIFSDRCSHVSENFMALLGRAVGMDTGGDGDEAYGLG